METTRFISFGFSWEIKISNSYTSYERINFLFPTHTQFRN
ncbi:hypothetical protein LEP1GSC202_0697 [Leptospira yanagawae serovar Saopaulo str. Sao Paulo = ATCC 700523]|uniref:Uncharacterized protein n=1 Tax=Leptospira yanagawae serovar Saopaulo str. Sao Paulo = ATCC 700523 TaxID=1249483 RepID=A0A5E8HF43_9LEPT|nr:hypothetical protein LEP1GSC202_0697 [Leptospira yanagawae serovar Saopaulo str. Sao Paulo = ATCC 700523]